MPTPLAKGIIIAASVLVAAGIAAYENPQFREWVEKSSSKVAMAFRSLGEDLHGRRRAPPRPDPSMHEDGDEKAEERRRQARQEIMDRGRVLQEKRKRRRLSTDSSRTPSFDSMVDEQGNLRPEGDMDKTASATTTAFEKDIVVSPQDMHSENNHLRSRNTRAEPSLSLADSIDRPLQIRQLDNAQSAIPAPASQAQAGAQSVLTEPWESQYEQEMRTAWNIQLPLQPNTNAHPATGTLSHASESLIDLTPTTEDFPDPDYSIPSASVSEMQRSDYFSRSSHSHSQSQSQSQHLSQPRSVQTPSSQAPSSSGSGYYYAHPTSPLTPLQPRPISQLDDLLQPGSSAASVADSGSVARITHSEAEGETDDDLSEFGDGVRTPASAWTEVGSEVSGDA